MATRSVSCRWGTALHGDKSGRPYSVELCGGTHVGATGDIGLVRVVSEGAVAAGVRRIEALTGEAARKHLDEQDRRLKAIASTLKVSPADALSRVEALVEERKKLERDLADSRKKLALGGGGDGGAGEKEIGCGRRFPRQVGDWRVAEGSEAAGGCRKEVGRLRCRGFRRRGGRWQGERGRRRYRRSHDAFQRGRAGARGVVGAGRAGRRRTCRHCSGRWTGCVQIGRGNRRSEGRHAGGLTPSAARTHLCGFPRVSRPAPPGYVSKAAVAEELGNAARGSGGIAKMTAVRRLAGSRSAGASGGGAFQC